MKPITTLARVRLEVDGSPFSTEVGLLTHVLVQQRLSLPALCELTFADPLSAPASLRDLRPGQALRVLVEGVPTALFVGQITAVERVYRAANQRETVVRAYDALHILRKRQSVRAHVELTLADLANTLMAQSGVTVNAHDASPQWSFLIQHRQSDFDLLTELADRSGMYFVMRDNTLHLIALDGIGDALPLALGETLFEARFEVNADPALRTTSASGWNALRVEAFTGSAGSARSGRAVRLEADPADVNSSGERALVGEQAQNGEHAAALAQSELDRQIAREVTFWGVAEGDPLLRPAAKVQIDAVDGGFAGTYVLTSATHTIDANASYTTELSTVPPPPRERSYSASATIGVVSDIDAQLGRVRATLSAYNDVETDWMNVMSLGAGEDKGLIIVPDVGDEVLVLLMGDDPAQGIVLGGLYGMRGSIDPGIEDGAVRRFTLRTPRGQVIRLDDTHQSIRVENSDGSFVELTPDQVTLHAAVDLTVEAPGKNIVIRGRNIDFQRG